jgi:hypothetical protein
MGAGTSDVVEIVLEEGRPYWTITFEDGLVFEAVLEEERDLLTLVAGVGEGPKDKRLSVCETLLLYSSLRQRTGVTMALGEPEGEFEISCDLTANQLTPDRFGPVVASFVKKARLWRQMVALGCDQSALKERAVDFATAGIRA